MSISSTVLHPNSEVGSGRVRRYRLPGSKLRVTQITTFCPDVIGPGATHLYLIEADALILVDTGVPTDLAQAFFYHLRSQPMPENIKALPPDYSARERDRGLKLAGCSIKDIDLLVITHGHLDHFYMGRPIQENGRAKVLAHILDTPMITNPWGLLAGITLRRGMSQALGMPKPPRGGIKALGPKFNPGKLGLNLNVDYAVFEDGPLSPGGSDIADVRVIHIPGHSPGSIGLVVGPPKGPQALICGDVLLHPITPHPDDLLVYLRTLNKLNALKGVEQVLPAHGRVFQNLKKRIGQLKNHHRERLQQTQRACRAPKTVWDIATMKGYFDVFVDPVKFNPMAANEALVHINLLRQGGGLEVAEIKDGVYYFEDTGRSFEDVYGRIREIVNDTSIVAI